MNHSAKVHGHLSEVPLWPDETCSTMLANVINFPMFALGRSIFFGLEFGYQRPPSDATRDS
jgi:hypothetical protein